jgi:hypothetical protein
MCYSQLDAKTLASLTSRQQYSVKHLSARFDVVNFRDASRAAEDVLFENEAFIDIREDSTAGLCTAMFSASGGSSRSGSCL